MTGRLIDPSRDVVAGMATHAGIPGPRISTFLSHAESAARCALGTTFEIARIEMVANTGTYQHLTGLGALPSFRLRCFAVPPRIGCMATFPARAFAIVG